MKYKTLVSKNPPLDPLLAFFVLSFSHKVIFFFFSPLYE